MSNTIATVDFEGSNFYAPVGGSLEIRSTNLGSQIVVRSRDYPICLDTKQTHFRVEVRPPGLGA